MSRRGARVELKGIPEKHEGALSSKLNVRLWLRLLSCTMTVEKRLKRRFKEQFGVTLPRFDVLAALERHSAGMTMSELSRALLVSNANVTVIVQALVNDGYVVLATSASDRRASVARLTSTGRAYFERLAIAHHAWIDGLFSKLDTDKRRLLLELMQDLKVSIAAEGQADE